MWRMSTIRPAVFLVTVILCFINHVSGSTTSPTTTMGAILATVEKNTTTTTTTSGDNTTSNDTSTSSTNATSEISTSASTLASTSTPEMTTPTTTTAAPEFLSHNLGTAFYTLKLTVGPTNASDIQYADINMTESEILQKMETIFKDVASNVRLQRSKEGEYILGLDFFMSRIDNKTKENIYNVIEDINSDPQFSLTDLSNTLAKVDKFITATDVICQATNVCPLGFVCTDQGCEHMCKTETCSMHGTCVVRVLDDKSVGTMCNCDITFAKEYEGEHCESSRRGKQQIIAIVAGVLGGACFLLIIVLIIIIIVYMRAKRRRRDIVLQSADYYSSLYHNTPTGVENHGMEKINGTGEEPYHNGLD